jgi:hypothetical protein
LTNGKCFFECTTNVYTIRYLFDTFITITSCIKIISIHKYILGKWKSFYFETFSYIEEIITNCHKYSMTSSYHPCINWPTSLYNIFLSEFVKGYDVRTFFKNLKFKIIHWVGFNKHKDLENHYRKLLLLFSPFITNEISQNQTYSTWHDAYIVNETSIQKVWNKFVNAFNTSTTKLQMLIGMKYKLHITSWLLKIVTVYGWKSF